MIQQTEWTTKQELVNQLDIKPSEADKEIQKLILEGFVEADYSILGNPRYKLAEYKDGSHLKKIKHFLEEINIRHGYDHLVNKYILEGEKANIKDSEIFEINPKLIWILQKTNNQIFKRELPFDDFVLDCDLKTSKLWFKGIMIKKVIIGDKEQNVLFTFYGEDEYCNKNLMTMLFDEDDKPLSKLKKDDKWKNVDIDKHSLNELKVFVCNFLDFINNPEVRMVKFERTKKNQERRLKDGKAILPSINKIIIDGKLRSYYDNLTGFENIRNRYVVRGHFVRFWNKKRFSKLYSLLDKNKLPDKYYQDDKIKKDDIIVSFWKKPFIKGKGLLISKRYEVKKTKLRRKECKKKK